MWDWYDEPCAANQLLDRLQIKINIFLLLIKAVGNQAIVVCTYVYWLAKKEEGKEVHVIIYITTNSFLN